jgi:hypothetical protein
MTKNYREELIKEFPENELEWRVQQCGITNGKPWVMALVFVNARAVQNRLDDVFGWDNWSEEYREVSGSIICRLGVCIDGRWIYKENGASQTDIEAFKGGLSGAFKRVASSGYGIGRYLYNLDTKFVECSLEKKHGYNEKAKTKDKATNKTITIYWKIPKVNKSVNINENEIEKVNKLARELNASEEYITEWIMKMFNKSSLKDLNRAELNTIIVTMEKSKLKKEAV